jgi:hypothetical protein
MEIMMDWDDLDEEFTTTLSKKMYRLMIELNKTCVKEFSDFTMKELTAIKEFYGGSLVYSIYKDVEFVLSEPRGSDTIH